MPLTRALYTQVKHSICQPELWPYQTTDFHRHSANNIFVQIRDRSLLARYLVEQKPPPQDREAPYTPIPSRSIRRYYFKQAKSGSLDDFSVVSGDWGVASWKHKHLSENIQPVALRGPEVLIKAPWDFRLTGGIWAPSYWEFIAPFVYFPVRRENRPKNRAATTCGSILPMCRLFWAVS